MSEPKTKRRTASVHKFLNAVEHAQRREDGLALLDIFTEVTKLQPALWGDSIVGFGEYHYQSERSSQKGDWPLTGFSPRKANMTVYIMPGFKKYQDLLSKLGKHKTSVSCIYFTKLENIDVKVLKQIIRRSVADMKKTYQWKECCVLPSSALKTPACKDFKIEDDWFARRYELGKYSRLLPSD